jgi:hypothetical protein
MQFLIIAYDYDDAFERRMQSREQHIINTKKKRGIFMRKLIEENVEINLQVNNPLIHELNQALENKFIMENNFNHADPQFIDVAIFQYNAAQAKVNIILKQMKEEGVNYANSINL